MCCLYIIACQCCPDFQLTGEEDLSPPLLHTPHCICGSIPGDNEDSAQCDFCDGWFHYSCCKLDAKKVEKEDFKFKCPGCKLATKGDKGEKNDGGCFGGLIKDTAKLFEPTDYRTAGQIAKDVLASEDKKIKINRIVGETFFRIFHKGACLYFALDDLLRLFLDLEVKDLSTWQREKMEAMATMSFKL